MPVEHDPNQILRFPEMMRITGMPRSTVYVEIEKGRFPRPIRITPRRVGWPRGEIDNWLRERLAERPAPVPALEPRASDNVTDFAHRAKATRIRKPTRR